MNNLRGQPERPTSYSSAGLNTGWISNPSSAVHRVLKIETGLGIHDTRANRDWKSHIV